METESQFVELIAKVRRGDQGAAAAIVRDYEPVIQRSIRGAIQSANLTRFLDPADVCQSVFANFFVRVAAGQFELAEPAQLTRLLVTMAKNKVLDESRRHQSLRRGRGGQIQEAAGDSILDAAAADGPTPSKIVAGDEMVVEIFRRLTQEERFLAEQRSQGRGWAEIAAELGESPEAIRKRLARAIDRITAQLGLT